MVFIYEIVVILCRRLCGFCFVLFFGGFLGVFFVFVGRGGGVEHIVRVVYAK